MLGDSGHSIRHTPIESMGGWWFNGELCLSGMYIRLYLVEVCGWSKNVCMLQNCSGNQYSVLSRAYGIVLDYYRGGAVSDVLTGD